MSLSSPAVSVLIPVYKVTAYVAEAVESALQQTRQDHEILVINDACPDTENLEKVLAPYQSRIRYVVQPVNDGVAAARNRGLAESKGRYLAQLDGDDRWKPSYIEDQLGKMESDPSIDMLYPDAEIFGGTARDGELLRGAKEPREPATVESLVLATHTGTNVVMMKKEIVERVGGWDSSMRHIEDFDLWVRLAASGGKLVFNPSVLAGYRIRPGSLTENYTAMYNGQIRACEKAMTVPGVTAREREVMQWRINFAKAQIHLTDGKKAMAEGNAAKAIEHFEQTFPYAANNKVKLMLAGLRLWPGAAIAAMRYLENRRKK